MKIPKKTVIEKIRDLRWQVIVLILYLPTALLWIGFVLMWRLMNAFIPPKYRPYKWSWLGVNADMY